MSPGLFPELPAVFWLFALQAVTGLGVPETVANEVQRRLLKQWQLVLEDIPEIPLNWQNRSTVISRYVEPRSRTGQRTGTVCTSQRGSPKSLNCIASIMRVGHAIS